MPRVEEINDIIGGTKLITILNLAHWSPFCNTHFNGKRNG